MLRQINECQSIGIAPTEKQPWFLTSIVLDSETRPDIELLDLFEAINPQYRALETKNLFENLRFEPRVLGEEGQL